MLVNLSVPQMERMSWNLNGILLPEESLTNICAKNEMMHRSKFFLFIVNPQLTFSSPQPNPQLNFSQASVNSSLILSKLPRRRKSYMKRIVFQNDPFQRARKHCFGVCCETGDCKTSDAETGDTKTGEKGTSESKISLFRGLDNVYLLYIENQETWVLVI